jgi:hypothetical protein
MSEKVDVDKFMQGIEIALHQGLHHAVHIKLFDREKQELMGYAWQHRHDLSIHNPIDPNDPGFTQ